MMNEIKILGIGHPLMDLLVNVSETFLKKYNLNSNDCVLADSVLLQTQLFDEILKMKDVKMIPGGSIQNSIRTAQCFFNKRSLFEVCAIMGCVGDDDLAGKMTKHLSNVDHVKTLFVYDEHGKRATGRCACLITGHDRSLVSLLGACHGFQMQHLDRYEQYIQTARIIYTSGFFLVSNPECTFRLAKTCYETPEKTFAFNLSAAYVMRNHNEKFLKLLPYIDLVFGNGDEVKTLAQTLHWKETDIETMVIRLFSMAMKQETPTTIKKPKAIIITQASDDIIICTNDLYPRTIRYPVPLIPTEQIIDTNGSGDAFVGAFLANYLTTFEDNNNDKSSLERCLQQGVMAAQFVIRQHGCQFDGFVGL